MKKLFLTLLILFLTLIGSLYLIFLSKWSIELRVNKFLQKRNPLLNFSCCNTKFNFKGLKNDKATITLGKSVLFEAEDLFLSLDILSLLSKKQDLLIKIFMKTYGGELKLALRSDSFKNFKKRAYVRFQTAQLDLSRIDIIKRKIKDISCFGRLDSFGSVEIIDSREIKSGNLKLNIFDGKISGVPILKELNYDIFKADISILNSDVLLENGFLIGKFFKSSFVGKFGLNRDKFNKTTIDFNCKIKAKPPFLENIKENSLLKYTVFLKEEMNVEIKGSLEKPLFKLL